MKQTFLLHEVIDDLVNIDKSLSVPLIKLNYFARLIKNKELIVYTQCELTGYGDNNNLPTYRRGLGTLYIDLQTPNSGFTKQLPVSLLEEPFNEVFKYINIKEGIATIEKLAAQSNKDSNAGQIYIPLPMELHFECNSLSY